MNKTNGVFVSSAINVYCRTDLVLKMGPCFYCTTCPKSS